MRLSETLPPPEEVAKEILNARMQGALLKRLYRLALDARAAEKRKDTDSKLSPASEGGK